MRDSEIFDGKSLKDLFRDIYDNQSQKKQELNEMINRLAKLITKPDDVLIVGTLIQSLMDTSVKNDEQLVKMANIVQRILSTDMRVEGASNDMLTEDEKQSLIQNAFVDMKSIVDKIEIAEEKIIKPHDFTDMK